MSEIEHAYHGSDADKTRAVYLRLIEHGQIGDIAINLLRTCKASERAKKYKGRYVGAAYDKKDWAIGELCRALVIHADDLGIAWGWALDEKTIGFEDVIYIDLPGCGQVSFHTSHRRAGPNYVGSWDGIRGEGASRIIKFAEAVLIGEPPTQGENDVAATRTEGNPVEEAARGEVRHEGEQTSFDL
jgi:hypothetical protein